VLFGLLTGLSVAMVLTRLLRGNRPGCKVS
jgi:hypothetical protein